MTVLTARALDHMTPVRRLLLDEPQRRTVSRGTVMRTRGLGETLLPAGAGLTFKPVEARRWPGG